MRKIPFLFLSLFLAVFGLVTMASLVTAANNLSTQYNSITNSIASGDHVRIGQFYGGGGTATGYYQHDYVELFNPGPAPVSLDGWSLQYGSSTGNFGSGATLIYAFPSGATILPGRYLLVQLGSAGAGGIAFPVAPDFVTTNLNMAQGSGKVALATITTGLGCGATATPCSLPHPQIVDLVAYGAANNAEGDAPVNGGTALNNQQGGVRKLAGCQDTDVNNDDFDVLSGAALQPRNSSSPAHSCDGAPSVIDTNPVDGAANVELDATVTITFNEAVTVTTDWFDFSCAASGIITGTTAPVSPAEAYVITPANPFAYSEACTVTVLAAEVTNSGGLTMTTNYSFTFSTESLTGDVTFVYSDLEGVVQAGETVWIAGEFNGWTPTQMADAGGGVYTIIIANLASGDYEYKYIVNDGGDQWDWLNTTNRSLTVSGSATINDYRNVTVGYAVLQWPPTLTGTMYTATADVYGQLYINNVTNPPGEGRGLKAEVGYGDSAVLTTWDWFPMSFAGQAFDNDEFVGVFIPTLPGVFSYTVRFDGNWGAGNPNASWTYGDLTGVGPYPGGDFSLSDTGVITVEFASVPIAVARAGVNGEVFGLEGVVTAQNSTWNNAPEWVFQDASGGIAAFFITDPPISLGDTVRMVATRGSFNNQEQMVAPIYHFEVVASGPPVEPITYTTGQVASGISEGWLIEIEGIVGNMPANCGTAYNITLNDGSGAATVRIEAATGINLCNLGIQNGDMLGVTGFSTQFQATYQVKPRGIGDLKLFVDAPVVVGSIPANNATNVLTNTLITVQFSEPVTVTANWYAIQCSASGLVSASASAGPAESYVITPDNPFVYGEICHTIILADQVEDGEGNNMLTDYRFSFTVGPTPTIGACGDPAIPIHFIQGSGLATPIFGTTVVVEAVVVGSYQGAGQFSGFFLQERDDRIDDDPMTSEGIFIFHSATPVAPGQLVRVRGTATEFNGLTQLASVTTGNVLVCGSDFTVIPAEMTLPVDDMIEWEAVEGMLVAFTHELFVTEHFNLGRFGEVHLSVNDRLWNPTNIVSPGAPAMALQDLNNRSRIILDDGISTQNPANVIYPDPGLTYTNTLRTGAIVPQLIGVLDYRTNSYRIQPIGIVEFTNTADRPETMPDVGGTIKVASFNVLNYFTTLDTGTPICGPDQNMGCRGANSAFEFERQRTKILNAILQMDADVVGLIEIENHHADAAVIDLVAGLNDSAGAGTYAYIDTVVIGTDAIKQAFIYQPAAVTPVGDYAILDSSVDPSFIDTKSRPVLIQTFADNATGKLFTVAVNHLKSKGSPCDDIGDPDVGDGQGNCNVTRTTAAQALVNYLATDPTNSGSDRFLIIGDINAYAMEDPIAVILDDGYIDLLRLFYGDEAYSYVFDGQFGHLDHALGNPGVMPYITGATAWHINADEPRVLDYNVEFKTAQQIADWYGPGPFRSSDHDPVIVGLNLGLSLAIVAPEDGAVFTSINNTAVAVPVAITTTSFIIPDDGYWRLWLNDELFDPAVMAYETTIDLQPGVYAISAELVTEAGLTIGNIDTVTITVTAVYQLHLPVIMNGASGTAVVPTTPTPTGNMALLFSLPLLLVGLSFSRRSSQPAR